MGQIVSKDDFEWVTTDEPHATRRKEMLAKYPEIRQLYGGDERLPIVLLLMVLFQVSSLFLLRQVSWMWLLLLAYCLGGTVNHALMLGIHELSHLPAFGHRRILLNRLFVIFVNLPIGLPFAVSFKGYHFEHHRYQGIDSVDTDLPTRLEARLFSSTLGKLFWLSLQSLFYAIRPLIIRPKQPSVMEVANTIIQLLFNSAVVYFFGWRCFFYLFGGSLMAMGLHPVAGHFISEHYMFATGFETYSYYGPLNAVTFNVGYHNEHHDFPSIAGCRLPLLRKIAPEYYDSLPHHTSWVNVLYRFVTDPQIGLYSRLKRLPPHLN